MKNKSYYLYLTFSVIFIASFLSLMVFIGELFYVNNEIVLYTLIIVMNLSFFFERKYDKKPPMKINKGKYIFHFLITPSFFIILFCMKFSLNFIPYYLLLAIFYIQYLYYFKMLGKNRE